MVAHHDPEELLQATAEVIDIMKRICALAFNMAEGETEATVAL